MIEIKNLSYSVPSNAEEKDILKNINLSLADNKTYVITGANGSGKSTFVKLLMGLLEATEGEILWDKNDITHLSIDERARKGMAFAFQQPITFKGIKVRELLDLASGTKNNVGQGCNYLSMVGLCAKDYLDRPIDAKLSGGELKRIELAMVLARGGKVNIFDEPEAGIDLWSFTKLTNIFSSLKNCTNIIVSHQRKILEIADEIILLENGEVVKTGNYKEIAPLLDNKKCNRLGGKNE